MPLAFKVRLGCDSVLCLHKVKFDCHLWGKGLESWKDAKASVALFSTNKALSGELMCQFQDVPRRGGELHQSLPRNTKTNAVQGREQGNEALLDRWNHQRTAIL